MIARDAILRREQAPGPGNEPFRPGAGAIGPACLPDGRVRFRVWAPYCRAVAVRILSPRPRLVSLSARDGGWHEAVLEAAGPGTRYLYVLDGDRERPDPAAHALPHGVHGPAEVVDTAVFRWTDAGWRGLPLKDMTFYELHVGTFTPAGSFDAILPRLAHLRDLGITTIELMPVASFPGARNWGYDGVGLFAPQQSYGGPAGLQRLVDACHRQGLAVVLDVVYNHLGPEGNYLGEFGPYFTDRYQTPWGRAMNFDGEHSRGVRDFIVCNACYWIREYHLDGLRLDAIHGIFDTSPVHILRELNDAVSALARDLGRVVPVVAESDLNDRRIVDEVRRGGYGLAGQWSDDFHHSLHTLLTGERTGYYRDFGRPEQVVKAYTHGFVYDGEPSAYRGRPHGTPARDVPGERFVVCIQNHDQVGNRARGERLTALVPFAAVKLAAAALLVSPYVPLLFMGEEYGEGAPFQYFTDFGDPALRIAVARGRRQEFAAFDWAGEVPDPQDPATFARSRLSWPDLKKEPARWLWDYYRALLALRRRHPALQAGGKGRLQDSLLGGSTLRLARWVRDGTAAVALLHFSPAAGRCRLRLPRGTWRRAVDSGEARFGGHGAKSPTRLSLSVPGGVSLTLPAYGAVLYLRGRRGGEPARRSPAGGGSKLH